MRAIRVHESGSIDTMRLHEIPRPVPGAGEGLGVADAEDLRTRLVAEAPGRKRDRGQMRLQTARREANDQPPDAAPQRSALPRLIRT
jgi:hypothetical protein